MENSRTTILTNASYGLIKLYLNENITPEEAEDKNRGLISREGIGHVEQIEIDLYKRLHPTEDCFNSVTWVSIETYF
jgi:hypothetical protein